MGYADDAFAALIRIMRKQQGGPFLRFDEMFKGEVFVLNYLAAERGVTTPGELSQAMLSSTARIAVILGNLEQKGHLTREIDKADRRKIQVTITEAGRERVHALRVHAEEMGRMVFEQMGEEDTAEFLRLLDKFLDASGKVWNDTGAPDGERNMKRTSAM